LEKKGINPLEFSLEEALKNVLDANYPFQSCVQPNIPCVSDSKPYLHMHAFKKRKMYGVSTPTGSLSPISSPMSKDLSKMTARQQIRFLTSGETPKTLAPVVEQTPAAKPPARKRGRPRKEKTEEKKKVKEAKDSSSSSGDSDSGSDSDKSPPTKKKETKDAKSEKKREIKVESKQESKAEFRQELKTEVKQEYKSETQKQEVQTNGSRPYSYSSMNGGNYPPQQSRTEKQDPAASGYSGNGNGHPPKWENEKWEEKRSLSWNADANEGRPTTLDYPNVDSSRDTAWDTPWETNQPPQQDSTIPPNGGSNTYDVDHYSTVLVRNLNYSCTTEDLGELFKTCGHIEQITIPVDKITGKLRGYGFVKYKSRVDAEQAMQKLNFRVLKDRVIELEWSMDKAQQRKDGKLVCYKCGGDGHFARDCTAPYQAGAKREPEVDRDAWDKPVRDVPPPDISQRVHRGYICFKCGKEGHVANDCKEREEVGPGFKGVVCFKCGQGGHLANKCDKKMRGCFICGHDGHIAVECEQRFTYGLNQSSTESFATDKTYPKPADPASAWPQEANKYRKLDSSSPTNREPIVKDPVWDAKERDADRERLRDRKVTGWDDTEPRQEVRYTDPRDPRYSHMDPRYTDARYSNYGSVPYSNSTSNYYSNYNSERKSGWDDRESRGGYPDRYRDDPRYNSRDPRDASRYTRPEDPRYTNDAYGARPYSEPKVSTPVDPYRQPDPTVTLAPPPVQTSYYSVPTMVAYPSQATDNQFTMLAGQLAAQMPGMQQAVPAQLTPAQPSPAIQSPGVASTSNSKEDPKKRNFKHHCSKIVVARLSTYFNNGQISSKDDFKQLSRKIVSALLEKEQGKGYVLDRDTDNKIKKFVDSYYSQYQSLVTNHKEKTRNKVEDWLQQVEMYSPTSATTTF
jgi:RNA recognition motif-containing protein